ncbi:MAG: pyruvate formate lyase family protein [Chloroflexota bacterium]
MATIEMSQSVVPWWVRARAPWHGQLFDRMILREDDPEELRVQRLRQEITYRPEGTEGYISINRARLMTESYRETEGEPEATRRAIAFAHVLQHIPLPLSPYQLLAGSPASGLRSVEIEPEFHTGWLTEPVEVVGKQMTELDALTARANNAYLLSHEDKDELLSDIIPYWHRRSHRTVMMNELARNYPDALAYFRDSQTYAHPVGAGLCHTIQDYSSVLSKGLLAIKEEIRAAADGLDPAHPSGMQDFERRNLYEAMIVMADATIVYAHRYADMMDELAAGEKGERAAELREMARICRKVPAAPAETWWEALQSWTILHTVTFIVDGGSSHSAGRLDQYMLPYLTRDLAAGRISPKRAQELLECFFIKFNERQFLRSLAASRAVPGMRANDKITIGGTDRFGRDAANELSFMCLEAQAHVHLVDPNISVRLHRNTPDDLLHASLEVIRLGSGLPQLISDEAIVHGMTGVCGVSLADARNFADTGCQENVTDPNMDGGADCHGHTNSGYFNFAKVVELALFDGLNTLNGKQVSPRTGDPRTFASMAEFAEAVAEQIRYGVRMNVIFNNVFDYAFRRVCPTIYHSLMHPGPRRTGLDYSEGGTKYNWSGGVGVGLANAGDSLAAVERVIFESKSATWDELIAGLRADWQGYDELRRACLAAPKYGADDEKADRWAKFVLNVFYDALEQSTTPHGGRFVGGLYTMGHYVTRGELTAATPDGRGKSEPLADSGCSPSLLAPAKGPTATHRSVARVVDPNRTVNGVTFNQRFSQSAISNPREVAKWADLVRSYVDMGGQGLQYTVVDQRALLEAQQHPELYKDLIVRVGGYSAAFVELSRELQDSIIARAEQQL